jgi:dTDP-4-amino-4,6-dideoxygalactose transaminase
MKSRVGQLALFGGEPWFPDDLPVGRPNLGDRQRFLARINDLLDRRWLTNNGPLVQEFEGKVAELVGVKHCIAVCNATVALELAMRAVGLAGEVIVPSFTFVATAHALAWQRATPVFCDIDPATHNISPQQAERLITPRTTGIVGVHLWGRACDVDGLAALARRRGLKLLFDAAHAFGCTYRGQMVGGFGDAEVFSFHATKVVNSFEGGAILTGNDDLARRIRLMKNFGFAGYDTVVSVGTNGKMSEASAAMGLTSLESYEEFVEVNRRNYEGYREAVAGIPGLALMSYGSERSNYHYVILEVDEAAAGLSRDQLQRILWAERVLARRYFYPGCHRMEPYRTTDPEASAQLPETERLAARVLALPTGTSVGETEIRGIGGLLRLAVTHAPEIRTRWGDLPA